jgi:FAD/FMN-containing dehydrogenase
VRRTPADIRVVTSEADIANALIAADKHGIAAVVRGAGHSCAGQTVTEGALLVNMPGAAPVLHDDGTVEISSGTRWRSVERFLNSQGCSIPVLADYLGLSVGGTLSVGGYGAESVQHGAQVDHVARLRLIRSDGTACWCSPDENSELFSFALAGLGRLGAIERAVVRTVRHRRWTSLFTMRHANLRDMVASMRWLADDAPTEVMLFKGLHSRGRFITTAGMHSDSWREALDARVPPKAGPVHRRWITLGYREWRHATVSIWVARFGACRRVWSDYLFDYRGLTTFTAFLDDLIARNAFGGQLASVYIVPIKRLPRAVRFPLEATDAIDAPMSFGIGLYSMIAAGADRALAQVLETIARCLDKCLELNGRPYRYGWHQLDEERARRVYGAAYDRWIELGCG